MLMDPNAETIAIFVDFGACENHTPRPTSREEAMTIGPKLQNLDLKRMDQADNCNREELHFFLYTKVTPTL